MTHSNIGVNAILGALLALGLLSFTNLVLFGTTFILGGSPWQLDFRRGGLDTLAFGYLWVITTGIWTYLLQTSSYLPQITTTGGDSP